MMKNVLMLILLTALISCAKQEGHHSDINVINVSSFSFFKIASGNSIPLSANENNITSAFGEPIMIENGVADLNKFPCSKWLYRGATIYMQAGRMVDIDLSSPDFGFSINGMVIKVGQDIGSLKNIFPDSFSSKSTHQVMVGLHYNGEPIDSRIIFDFNDQNQITGISLMD